LKKKRNFTNNKRCTGKTVSCPATGSLREINRKWHSKW